MHHRIVMITMIWWCYLAMKRSFVMSLSCTGTCSQVFNTRFELDTAISTYTGPNGPNGDINQWCFPDVTNLALLFQWE